MARIRQQWLFSWEQVDKLTELERFKLVLDNLPDEELMKALERRRGGGRNDYPVRAMWNAYIAHFIFQCRTISELIRMLRVSPPLREVCGFDPMAGEEAVPSHSAFSRFISILMEHSELVDQIFEELVSRVSELLPGFGRELAIDSKALRSYGKPVRDEKKKKKRSNRDRRRENDADWGVKKRVQSQTGGSTREKKVCWFGFKDHLVVDSTYELPVAFAVTEASVSDTTQLIPLIEKLMTRHPQIVENCEVITADKAYDSIENYTVPLQRFGIKAVIANRLLWRDEQTRPVFSDRAEPHVYDENGSVWCMCPDCKLGELSKMPMVWTGYEKDRQTIRFTCQAKHYDTTCPNRHLCTKHTIRIKLHTDPRIFCAVARNSYKWQRCYNKRTGVERVFARMDTVLGFEDHTIRGMAKMKLWVTVSYSIMLAMAIGRIRANQADRLRSLSAPVRLRA